MLLMARGGIARSARWRRRRIIGRDIRTVVAMWRALGDEALTLARSTKAPSGALQVENGRRWWPVVADGPGQPVGDLR